MSRLVYQLKHLLPFCVSTGKKVLPFLRAQKKRDLILGGAIVALLMLGTLFLGSRTPPPKDPPPFIVQTRSFESTPLSLKLSLNGKSETVRSVVLKAETRGVVAQLFAKQGTVLRHKQEILKLKEAGHPERLLEAQAALKYRLMEMKSDKRLGTKGLKAENALAQSQAALEKAKADLIEAEKSFKDLIILAPFDGFIEEKLVNVGDYVAEGTPLVKILDLNPITVICFVSEQDIHHFALGREAAVVFPHFRQEAGQQQDKPFKGKVTFISKEADPQTRTYRLEMEIPNPDLAIPAGLTAHVSLQKKLVEAHRIPASALVLSDSGLVGVKIFQEGKALFKAVQILESTPNEVVVTGLPAQMTLITYGGHFVSSGETVVAQKEETAPSAPPAPAL